MSGPQCPYNAYPGPPAAVPQPSHGHPTPRPPISARHPDPTFSAGAAGVGSRRPNRPIRHDYQSDDDVSDDDRRGN
jgi:hypothetical protein